MKSPPDNPFNGARDSSPDTGGDSELKAVVGLVNTGLPVAAGLLALSEEAPSRRMRSALRHMGNELAAGSPPEDVFSQGGRGLPHYVRGLVRAGVSTGQLGTFLEEFLLALRKRRSARQSYWLALAYPTLLLPLAILAASVFLALIVPQFKDMFEGFGLSLPGVTLFVINLADFLRPPVLIAGLFAILLLPLLWQLMSLSFGPAVWTRFIQSLPVVGTPSRMRGMSEFCSFLGLLVSGGIPLGDALDMTAAILIDPNLKSGTRKLAARVSSGESMQDAALRLPHFSAELRSQFRWEHRGESFGEMLRQAGRVFAARSQVQAGMAVLFFVPLLMLLIGGFVGLIVIALYMPLIRLLNELT